MSKLDMVNFACIPTKWKLITTENTVENRKNEMKVFINGRVISEYIVPRK